MYYYKKEWMYECEFVGTGYVFWDSMYVWDKYSHLKLVFQRQEHIMLKRARIRIPGKSVG